jgi:hypothetical protein
MPRVGVACCSPRSRECSWTDYANAAIHIGGATKPRPSALGCANAAAANCCFSVVVAGMRTRVRATTLPSILEKAVADTLVAILACVPASSFDPAVALIMRHVVCTVHDEGWCMQMMYAVRSPSGSIQSSNAYCVVPTGGQAPHLMWMWSAGASERPSQYVPFTSCAGRMPSQCGVGAGSA